MDAAAVFSALAGLGQWFWGAVLLPVLGALGFWWRRRRAKIEQERAALDVMRKLHPNEKTVLVQFIHRQTDTWHFFPGDAGVQQLLLRPERLLAQGVRHGEYAAVARFFTLREPFYRLLPRWAGHDMVAADLLAQLVAQAEEDALGPD